jgi:signal transduction histidine kinase
MVKILLVDDKAENLLSLKSIFYGESYQIVTADSGMAALKILLTELDFALILMDIEMPEMNGFETAALIHSRDKLEHIPIVFITAHSHADTQIYEGYLSGAVDYIYKPIHPQLLLAKTKVFVELHQKNRQLQEQEQILLGINNRLELANYNMARSESEVKELNAQLQKKITELEVSNKELDSFAYMVAHDLQEPIRKIKTYNDQLKTKLIQADDESHLYMSKTQNACKRMQRLINEIFSFSKITASTEYRKWSDLNLLMQEVLVDMDLLIQENSALVVLQPLPSMFVYPNLIKSLFYNLISNSIKYAKKDCLPEIKISCTTDYSGIKNEISQDYCTIHFEDNGIGFNQKLAEEIFLLFNRLQTDRKGNGIGLAICKKIVSQHQGQITATSEINKGSTFNITFPIELIRLKKESPNADKKMYINSNKRI